jgi:anti-sigma regulatory factor (Ser/Thr protein kinase)
VTFAQTWDVGYGTGEDTLAAPRQLAASTGPRLAPQCPGSLGQVPQRSPGPEYPPDMVSETNTLRQALLSIGPEAAKAARDFTTTTLREWQLDELVQEAVLIASELVTNAIRHGLGGTDDGVELAWQRQAARVICLVTDRSPLPPVLGSADQDAESGRGLQVVQALAATWGWMMLSATSKAVWAALTISR